MTYDKNGHLRLALYERIIAFVLSLASIVAISLSGWALAELVSLRIDVAIHGVQIKNLEERWRSGSGFDGRP